MRLSWNETRARAANFARTWQDASYEKGETQSFHNAFFEIFGVRRRSVARYEEHVTKLDNRRGFSDRERSQIWHIFACIRMTDLKRLLTWAGLSLYEIARAIHLSDTRRAEVCTWINQFAVHPNEHDTLEMIE